MVSVTFFVPRTAPCDAKGHRFGKGRNKQYSNLQCFLQSGWSYPAWHNLCKSIFAQRYTNSEAQGSRDPGRRKANKADMAKLLKKKSGFTLIELMIVVAILGILAALAVPAFITYVKRSKTGEATINLSNMFKTAASYYNRENAPQGLNVMGGTTKCIVGNQNALPGNPGVDKQQFSGTGQFGTLGYSIADPVYFSYGITSAVAAGGCTRPPSTNDVYTFFANGDIDGDNVDSTFELSVGSNGDNELYHGVGYYVNNELE